MIVGENWERTAVVVGFGDDVINDISLSSTASPGSECYVVILASE